MADQINTHKVSTIISLALSIYANTRYFVGRSPYDHHNPYNVANTPFSGNIIVTLVFWIVLYIHQILFVTQIFLPQLENHNDRINITNKIGWHFTVFNLGSFFWIILFVKKHFFWSELILIINFINVLQLYYIHKTNSIKPLTNWILIHLPTTALPLSWLVYAIFWNGAVLFNVHKFVGRIVSNVLIWDFLLFGLNFIWLYNDYAVGLSTSVLTFGLGLGQLFTRAFALQWIFAFVISGLLFVASILAAFVGPRRSVVVDEEQAPLLE